MSAKLLSPIFRLGRKGLIAVVLLGLAFGCRMGLAADRLTIHEWGTFTALQDEQGRALGGINVDDEQLPDFVHDINPLLIGPSYSLGRQSLIAAALLSKGIPEGHPDVTMRLETPLIYFHLPPGSVPVKLNVDVALRGGWLTQFYPNAELPGRDPKTFGLGPITPKTTGRLAWHDLTVGTNTPGPKTDSHVWEAPRNVRSVGVTTAGKSGESEKYLFYRGVGNFAAPLEVAADNAGDAAKNDIVIRSRFEEVLGQSEHLSVGPMWLVQVQADGRVAFRPLGSVQATGDRSAIIGRARASFAPIDFSLGNLDYLRSELRQALVQDGLYADEAAALIETWDQAYFRSPGLRLFFLVPRRWTNHYLPLSFSVPADVQRVMVGRIEIVSPQQRAALNKLAQMKISDTKWIGEFYKSKNVGKFVPGQTDPGQLGLPIPPDYQTYLDLGRFRNALVFDAQHHHPTPSLAKFISVNNLSEYSPPRNRANKH